MAGAIILTAASSKAALTKQRIEQKVGSELTEDGFYTASEFNDVAIKRKIGEGSKPLFQREDISINGGKTHNFASILKAIEKRYQRLSSSNSSSLESINVKVEDETNVVSPKSCTERKKTKRSTRSKSKSPSTPRNTHSKSSHSKSSSKHERRSKRNRHRTSREHSRSPSVERSRKLSSRHRRSRSYSRSRTRSRSRSRSIERSRKHRSLPGNNSYGYPIWPPSPNFPARPGLQWYPPPPYHMPPGMAPFPAMSMFRGAAMSPFALRPFPGPGAYPAFLPPPYRMPPAYGPYRPQRFATKFAPRTKNGNDRPGNR